MDINNYHNNSQLNKIKILYICYTINAYKSLANYLNENF